jgi:hypothetical protein
MVIQPDHISTLQSAISLDCTHHGNTTLTESSSGDSRLV